MQACWLVLEGELGEPVGLASGGADSLVEPQLKKKIDLLSCSYPFSSQQFASVLLPTKKISCPPRSQDRA